MSLTLSRPFTISTYDPPSTIEFYTGGQVLGGQTPRAYEHGATGTPPRQRPKSVDLDKTPP